ncbi:MAG TPA: hypothetical protein VGF67_13475 [Ktedonobacteraceae bacterium]|jgi:hypothetical protein
METHIGQGNVEGSSDPLVDALLKELIDEAPRPKASRRALTDALTEELLHSLKEAEHASPEAVSLQTLVLVEALAPALAETLAPALAEALIPALIKALQTVTASTQTARETSAKKSSE